MVFRIPLMRIERDASDLRRRTRRSPFIRKLLEDPFFARTRFDDTLKELINDAFNLDFPFKFFPPFLMNPFGSHNSPSPTDSSNDIGDIGKTSSLSGNRVYMKNFHDVSDGVHFVSLAHFCTFSSRIS